jgi:hypothetical protein
VRVNVNDDLCFGVKLGNGNGDRGAGGSAFDMDITFDQVVVGAAEMQIVIVDELRWNFDERDVASKAAIVPPVGLQGGNAVGDTGVVDGEDDEVAAVFEGTGNIAIEWSEAAFVLTDFLGVNPDESTVVGGADVEESAGLGPGSVLEVLLIPNGAFVVEELGSLRVPVARNLKRGGDSEVVVLGMAVGVERGVHKEAVFAEILMKIVEACGVLIDDSVPVFIQGDGGAMVHINKKCSAGLCNNWRDEEKCGDEDADRGLRHK